MKDDARRFMFTIVSIPALLASAAGVHTLVTPPPVAPIVEETLPAKPVAVTKTPAPAPKKAATAPIHKVITVTPTPVPVTVPAPVYTYTPPPDPVPVERTVIVRRVRTTSAS